MTDATLLTQDEYRSVDRLRSWVYEIPSVAIGGDSDEMRLPVGVTEGAVAVVRIACNSTDFDLSIRAKAGVAPSTIYEIIKVVNIDKSYSEVYYPRVIFSNGEEPAETANLYAVISNNDTVVTGTIMMELIISKV